MLYLPQIEDLSSIIGLKNQNLQEIVFAKYSTFGVKGISFIQVSIILNFELIMNNKPTV